MDSADEDKWLETDDEHTDEESEIEDYLQDLEKTEGLTDVYNANKFQEIHGENVKFCHKLHKWLLWDGKRWRVDEKQEILIKAIAVAKMLEIEADRYTDKKEKARRKDHARKTKNKQKLLDLLYIVRSFLPILPDDLDKNDYLLNLENGTLDLKTGFLHGHKRETLITKLAPVNHETIAECPRWMQFLDEVMDSSQEKIDFLQKALGYSLTGATNERVFFILFGTGANGKSTFLNTISALFGNEEYAMATPTQTLFAKREGGIPNDIARLRGARFVTAYEGDENRRLDEGLIKRMTGSDILSARFMRAEWFDFYPKFKLWFATNHKPMIHGTDKAIWDRIRLIPFTVRIPEEKQDLELIDKLKKELPGILNWAIDGCLKWFDEGLGYPDEIKNATMSYRYEMDKVGTFLSDFCIVSGSSIINNLDNNVNLFDLKSQGIPYVKCATLFDKYITVTGDRDSNQTAFGRKMNEAGFFKKRFRDGYHWIGIGILDESTG